MSIKKSGNIDHGRETMTVELNDGRKIEVFFQFCGCGVLPQSWDGFMAVNEEELAG